MPAEMGYPDYPHSGQLQLWGIFTTPLRCGNLEWLTELWKALSILLLVYCKGYNSGTAKWKRWIGHSIGGGWSGALPCPLCVGHPPSTSVCSPTCKLSESCCLGVLMEILLCWGWLIKVLAVGGNSISSSLSSSWTLRGRVGLKIPSF